MPWEARKKTASQTTYARVKIRIHPDSVAHCTSQEVSFVLPVVSGCRRLVCAASVASLFATFAAVESGAVLYYRDSDAVGTAATGGLGSMSLAAIPALDFDSGTAANLVAPVIKNTD